jgi:hypothetical protein
MSSNELALKAKSISNVKYVNAKTIQNLNEFLQTLKENTFAIAFGKNELNVIGNGAVSVGSTFTFEDNYDSINKAVENALSEGLSANMTPAKSSLVDSAARIMALSEVFDFSTNESWMFDYIVSQFEDSEADFKSELIEPLLEYTNLSSNAIVAYLVLKYLELMAFAEVVADENTSSEKVFLLTTDYNGGYINSWVVCGTYDDAVKSMVEAIKDIDSELDVTIENFETFVEKNVGTGDDYLYTASIEEV